VFVGVDFIGHLTRSMHKQTTYLGVYGCLLGIVVNSEHGRTDPIPLWRVCFGDRVGAGG
jgi:hypothetical protein